MMQSKSYSSATQKLVDDEIRRILFEAEDTCRDLLTEYRHGLDLVARALLEHETISGSEVERLIEISRQPDTDTPNPSPLGSDGDAVEVGASDDA
jgi:cell division protease FtsH